MHAEDRTQNVQLYGKIYKLEDRQPTVKDGDPWGAVLAWSLDHGWFVVDWRVVANSFANKLAAQYPYWTHMPSNPVNQH